MAHIKNSSQSRKWQITINNPEQKGLSHDVLIKKISALKSLEYMCLSDEIGGETKTYHTHIYAFFTNPKAFSTICNICDGKAHVEVARGSHIENRDYIFKQGRWENTEKSTTSIPSTKFEFGEIPPERMCPKPELQLLYELIKEGKSNAEILEEYPEYMFDISHIDRTRLILRQEQYKDTWRNIECVYIQGKTASGKSRYVMEKYGYANVFRVTDYTHPFDTYDAGQNILMLEEYNSSFRLQDVLNYLDGYPLKLPARYSDKIACYTRVYITTNTPLEKQYPNAQLESPETWKAFLRRINKVMYFKSKDEIITYESTDEYFKEIRENQINSEINPFNRKTTLKKEYSQLGFKAVSGDDKLPFD